MGKSSRKKKNLKPKTTLVKPDDYCRFGPIEMARFGKEIVSRNTLSEEKFELYQRSIADKHPEVCTTIDYIIQKIVQIVSTLPPLELLKRAHWNYISTFIGIHGNAGDAEKASSLRMIDYIQSIVASAQPAGKIKNNIKEETYGELEILVEDLFHHLTFYFISRSANEIFTNPNYNQEYDKFYTSAQMHWCMVRGDRYQAHEINHHSAILSPHDDIIHDLFGINTGQIMEGVDSILASMTSGVLKCIEDLKEFQKLTTNALSKHIENAPQSRDIQDLMQDVIQENGWEDWQHDVLGRFDGYDLHDLQKVTNLPTTFLEAFSWEQGEETEFLSGDEMRGWPLKIWPIFKRPFLKVDGHFYCFECHSLLDNLYRQIQRAIFDNRPEYKSIWAKKQQEISETLPVEFFEKILPGAAVYKSVHYPWPNKNDWTESDIVICYEDHLFIIEVKAGSFTYTSPATDFPSYISSLKTLVYKPAKQGTRFLEYLHSKPTAPLYDKTHNEVGILRSDDYYQFNICAVTLDSFTEIACQPEQLKGIGIDVGEHPIWSFSIDDLRVYADIFSNPLVFLHYAEQRKKAFNTEHMTLTDEMDHLGLYLAHNAYANKPLSMLGAKKIHYHGFTSKVDEYYTQRLLDPDASCPLKQDMPQRLDEILNVLSRKKISGRRKAASMILDCGGEWRDNIAASIDQVLSRQRKRGTIQPIATIGETKVSIVCWDPKVSEVVNGFAHDHCYATMIIAEDDERTSFELFFNEEQKLVDISFDHLKLCDIPPEEIERLKALSNDLKAQRWRTACQSGKVGRNQLCLCGSGKKYKKCCGG